jgi:hypothetical protein
LAVTRRQIFQLGPALLAAAAMPAKVFGGTPRPGLSDAEAALLYSKDRFRTLVNSSFAVRSQAAARSWLVLLSVEDLTAAPDALHAGQPRFDTFALHFYGAGEPLSQNTYELEHATLGRFSLFVVPSGASKYTATINRFTGAGLPYEPPVKQTQPVDAASAPETR